MSKFLTELDTHLKHGRDDVWILDSPLIYDSDLVGRIVVPAGFETDLSSVPRIPFIFAMWGNRSHHEGAVHDALFRVGFKPEVTWQLANMIFLEAMEARGKPWYIKYPMYWGVCLGSKVCFKKRLVFDAL